MRQATYASGDVKVSWQGFPIEGLAPDSFLTAVRNEDVTDEEVGSDGQLSVSALVNKSGTFTLTLQQSSISNNILASVLAAQERTSQVYYGNIVVSDPSGAVIANFYNCHIKTSPEIDVGNTATGKTRQWVFFVQDMRFEGLPGQNALTSRVTDFISAQAGGVISRAIEQLF